jgi:hypothetical protein
MGKAVKYATFEGSSSLSQPLEYAILCSCLRLAGSAKGRRV